jgi:hypothetical protein
MTEEQKERKRQVNREWRKRNREHIREYNKRYRLTPKGKACNASCRKRYYEKHKARIIAKVQDWQKKSWAVTLMQQKLRRAAWSEAQKLVRKQYQRVYYKNMPEKQRLRYLARRRQARKRLGDLMQEQGLNRSDYTERAK